MATNKGKSQSTGNKAQKDSKETAGATQSQDVEDKSNSASTSEKIPEDSIADAVCPDIEQELVSEQDKYLRLAAEYDNYRKRSAKERDVIYRDARVTAITKLLPVYDNLERALKMECTDEAYYKGVEMIMLQMEEIFEDIGVRHIPAVGKPFDPNLHNAIMKIENPELGENIIAEELQKGFIIGDRVIRFSNVVVAN